MIKNCFLLCLISLTLVACADKQQPQPPREYAMYCFQQGELALEDGDYTEAIAQWQKVRDSFTAPELTTLAELKIADAQFENEMFIEAIASYEDFLKQHPSNIHKSAVLFRLGKAHFEQILSADRDQTATRNALNTFEQLKKNFPHTVNPQELDNYILQCRTRLAENEMYIGHFYLKTKRYKPAIARLERIRTNYPEFNDMAHVILYLAQAQRLYGDTDKALSLLGLLQNDNLSDIREEAADLRNDWTKK